MANYSNDDDLIHQKTENINETLDINNVPPSMKKTSDDKDNGKYGMKTTEEHKEDNIDNNDCRIHEDDDSCNCSNYHWREEESFSLSSSTNCFTVTNKNKNYESHDNINYKSGECWSVATLYDSVDISLHNNGTTSSLGEKENPTEKWNVHYHSLPTNSSNISSYTNKNIRTDVSFPEKKTKTAKLDVNNSINKKRGKTNSDNFDINIDDSKKKKNTNFNCTSHCILELLPNQYRHKNDGCQSLQNHDVDYYYTIKAFAIKHASPSEKKSKKIESTKNDHNDNEEDNNTHTSNSVTNKSTESSVKSTSSSTTKGTKNNGNNNKIKPVDTISISSKQKTPIEKEMDDKYSIIVQVVTSHNLNGSQEKKKKRQKVSKTIQFQSHANTRKNTEKSDTDKTHMCPIVLHLFPMTFNSTKATTYNTGNSKDDNENRTKFILAVTHLHSNSDNHEDKSDDKLSKDGLGVDPFLSCYVFSIMNDFCDVFPLYKKNSKPPSSERNPLIYSPIYFLPLQQSSLKHSAKHDQNSQKIQLFSKIANIYSPIMAFTTTTIDNYPRNDGNDSSTILMACACQDGSVRIIAVTPTNFKTNNHDSSSNDDDAVSMLPSYQLQTKDITLFQVDGSVVAIDFYAYNKNNKLALVIASLDGFACLYILDINDKHFGIDGESLENKNRNGNIRKISDYDKNDNIGWKGPFIITKNLRPSILTNYIMDDFYDENSINSGTMLMDSILSLHTFCYKNVMNCKYNDKNNNYNHAIVLGTYSGRVLLYLWNDDNLRSAGDDSDESLLLSPLANGQKDFLVPPRSTSKEMDLKFRLLWKCQLPYPIHGISTYHNTKRIKNTHFTDLLIVTRKSIHIMRNANKRCVKHYDENYCVKKSIATKNRIEKFIESYTPSR